MKRTNLSFVSQNYESILFSSHFYIQQLVITTDYLSSAHLDISLCSFSASIQVDLPIKNHQQIVFTEFNSTIYTIESDENTSFVWMSTFHIYSSLQVQDCEEPIRLLWPVNYFPD